MGQKLDASFLSPDEQRVAAAASRATGTAHADSWIMFTPTELLKQYLKEAFARAEADGVNASDEAGLVERLGYYVHVIQGSERNIKITKPADMELARPG